jgi:hypothetical protein
MRRLVLRVGASALLAGLGVAMQAAPAPPQDKVEKQQVEKKPEAPAAPAAPAGAQQDRMDIPGEMDSWYQVIQEGNHVGYVHVIIQRLAMGGPWRYNFNADLEMELLIEDPKEPGKQIPAVYSQRVRAKLDDTYAPVDWQESLHLNGLDMNSNVAVDEANVRKIQLILSATDRREFSQGSDEEVYYHLFLMFIALRQNGNLARPGTRKVSVFYPQPEGKPPLAEVQLEIREMIKKEYLGKKDVSVTRVMYLKPPPAPSRDAEWQEAFVDRYGRVVEQTSRAGVRWIMVKGEEEALGKGTSLRQGARRDPFRKDLAFTPLKGEKEEGGAGSKGPKPPTNEGEFRARLEEAKKKVEDLRKAKEDNRESDGDQIYQEILEYHAALKKSHQEKPQPPELARQMDDLRRQIEEIWQGAERLMRKLRVVYVRTLEHFDRDQCDDMAKGIEELKKGTEKKELQDTPQLLELGGWIARVEPLLTKCRTRLELARKKIVLTGTVAYEEWTLHALDAGLYVFGHQAGGTQEVRFIKPSRMAIINGKVYRVGDVVETEAVRVEKIWPYGVQVSLREETRDVGIRQ